MWLLLVYISNKSVKNFLRNIQRRNTGEDRRVTEDTTLAYDKL